MKKVIGLLLIAVILMVCGCNANDLQKDSGLEFFKEDMPKIIWNGDTTAGVQSYQANVEIYGKNNRYDTHSTFRQSYRMAVKALPDEILTRLDFATNDDIRYRSLISNGEEMIFFETLTENIIYRIPMEETSSPLNRLFGNQIGLSRINLSLIREEARRLSLNIIEGSSGTTMMLEIPPTLIPQNGFDRIISSRVSFDLLSETILESEVILIRADETKVTTTVTPVYDTKDGVPVKIGQITIIDSKAPALEYEYELDPDTIIYNSIDDIPTISEKDYNLMVEAGNLYEVPDVKFGDPRDLSYIETIYEVYKDIEINSVSDNMFRLIQR